MSGSFIDTNILLYALSADRQKADRAEAVLSAGGIVSVQVLNEFAAVARRKLGLPYPEIAYLLATYRGLVEVRPLTVEIHLAGLALAGEHDLSIYDAMIVASALEAGCDVLYSEDMQAGRVFEGRLRLVNPF
ncbi:PIN domain-containing protein [Paradevosia shaoguanensis]|uniref:PIN domain-containing protein n=1 Tax=Paradevosia shaoguanensis TaxID=1335043 RepID=UPI001932F504|nr:PIN domain-containing protein [Paradevosia shaoguanensis]